MIPHLGAAVLLVVRPLDPAVPHRRSACLASATSALQTLVRRFPMVSFHEASQRVAVGTSAGYVLLLDAGAGVETARLTGHTGAIAAVAFSPSGTRLASFCLSQGQIRVYVLNGSFFGFGSAPHCVASFSSDSGKDARARSATQLQMLEQLELKWQGDTTIVLVRGWLGTQAFQMK
jgi:WD40 repeat protein